MRFSRVLRTEFLALAAVLVVGGLIGWATTLVSAEDKDDYEVIAADDLEPFRSAFNAASGHIRAVLLVGPT